MGQPEKKETPDVTSIPAEAKLTKEQIDEYEKQVNSFVGTTQKDINEIAAYYRLVPPTIDINQFDENGKCKDANLLKQIERKIVSQEVRDKVLTIIVFSQVLRSAIANARKGKIATESSLQAALEASLDKIKEASQIQFAAPGDPLAEMAPRLGSGGLTVSNVSEILQQRKQEAENKQSNQAEQKRNDSRERENALRMRNHPEEAANGVVEAILKQDVMAGLNNRQNARAKEDLKLSDAEIANLKRFCAAAKEGTVMNVDLANIGARTIDGSPIPAQGPVRVDIIPSRDGRFVQLKWTVRMPSPRGGGVDNVNLLNIALDGSAYTIDSSKPEGQQVAFREPNLKPAAVNPEVEQQKEYEAQYSKFLAELKDAPPGARISMIQRTTRYFPAEGVSKEVLINIVVKKWHNIDGRADQYAVYSGEKIGDGEWPKQGNRTLVSFNDIQRLTSLPRFATGGRIQEMTRPTERVSDRVAGVKRSYDIALREIVSLGQAMQMKTFTLPPDTAEKYQKSIDQIFTLIDNYGLPEGIPQRLADAGFKLNSIVDDEGTKIRVAFKDAVKNETRTTEIITEQASV